MGNIVHNIMCICFWLSSVDKLLVGCFTQNQVAKLLITAIVRFQEYCREHCRYVVSICSLEICSFFEVLS